MLRTCLLAMVVMVAGCGPAPIVRPSDPPPGPTPTPAVDRPAKVTDVPPSPTFPERPASTPETEAMWTEAATLEAEGRPFEGRRVLRRLVREAPGTPEAARARVRLAEHAIAHGAWAEAEAWVEGPAGIPAADAEPADDAWRYRGFRARALAYEGQRRWDEAARIWLGLGDSDEPAEAAEGAARALFLSGETEQATEALAPAAPGATPEAVSERLEQLVEPVLTGEVLEALYGRLPDGNPWKAWVALKVARERWQAGEMEAAEAAAVAVRAETRDPAERAEAEALLAQLAAWRQVEPRTLGVLLPLSGPHEGIGRAALEGLQLAIGADSGLKLIVRDTKGDAAEAARQAESLVLEGHVAAMLGPVGHLESAAVAEVTQRFGVPHVLLTSAHEVGVGKPWVFRTRLSPEEQAAAVARYAVTNMGVQRVGILYPEGTLGETSMAAFFEEIVRLGGEVRAVEAYGKDGQEVRKAVGRLVAATRPGRGVVDFEAVFVPDEARDVKRVLPFLASWGLLVKTSPELTGTSKRPALQMLGSSGWNDPVVIDVAQRLTENAVFVAPFFHDPDEPRGDRFARAFFTRYKRKPFAFHAEAHDAAALIARALVAPEGNQAARRAEVLAALKGVRNLEGATGLLSVLESGQVVRRPKLLTVHGDELRARLSEDEEAAMRRPVGPDGPR